MSNIFSQILTGVDGSDASLDAVRLAARLALKYDGRLVLCYSVDWVPLVAQAESAGAPIDTTPIIEGLEQQGKAILAQAADVARHEGIDPELHTTEGPPAEGLLAAADRLASQIIVMGTHGRHGLGRLFIGSTTEAVLRTSTIPVLTLRSGVEAARGVGPSFRRIVVGLDDSQPSDAALSTVLQLPPDAQRKVCFCSVVDPDAVGGPFGLHASVVRAQLRAEARILLEDAATVARAHGVLPETRVVEGPTAATLIEAAHDRDADLIVVGSHGRRGLRRFFLGSIAERVVRTATVPVLVVRAAPVIATQRLQRIGEHSSGTNASAIAGTARGV